MNVMITGGSGLIGTALTRAYQDHGHQVIKVSRRPGKTGTGVQTITWDSGELRRELEKTDTVIHLAGASIAGSGFLPARWTEKRKNQIIQSRSDTGSLLSEIIQKIGRKPKVFIQASAIGFYGNTGDGPVDETSPPGADFLAEVCQTWEASTDTVETEGVRRVIARIGLVLSRDGGLFPLLALPYRLYLGGRIGNGKQFFSWIHITDLVRSIQHLAGDPSAQGIFNLTAPNPVNQDTFGNILSAQLNRPDWFTVPGSLLKLALGEAATLALDGREVHPVRLTKSGFSFTYPQLQEALAALTHPPSA